MEINVDIKSTGIESAVVYAPFDEALEALTEKGYEIISLPENAKLRIEQGKDAYISGNGNWTREGILYIPKEKPKLVRNSPILYSAKEATKAHREGKEFYPVQEQIEKALADSTDFPQEDIEISTNRFDSEALTVYAFGGEKKAENYGEFLREAGIKKMPVYAVNKSHVDKQGKPFVRQMWFWYLGDRSLLGGDGWGLDGGGRLRGVKMGAEGTAPKIQGAERYSPEVISKALNELGFSGLEKTLLTKLRQ